MKHHFFSPIRLTKMEKLGNFMSTARKGVSYNTVDGSTGAMFAGQFGNTHQNLSIHIFWIGPIFSNVLSSYTHPKTC